MQPGGPVTRTEPPQTREPPPVTIQNILYWAFAAYLVATGIYIISENRQPSKTFSWMLLFTALPGVGVLIYFLFGRDLSFGHSRTLMQQDLAGRLAPLLGGIEPQHQDALRRMANDPGASRELAELVRSTSHSPVTTRNSLQILRNADEAYPPLLRDMRHARHSIHLQFYSWNADELGGELKRILHQKVAEGVEVRILYDPIGSLLMLKRRYIREMRAGGVRMEPFSKLWRLHTISYRNHRKIAVFDGLIGHTGGLNIGGEHIEPPKGFDLWRDTNIRVVGSAASLLQVVFAIDWHNATGEDLLTPQYFPPAPAEEPDPAPEQPSGVIDSEAGVPVQMSVSGPDSEWRAIRQLYFALITSARSHVYLQSPFFILDVSIAEALKAAALAGIDVRIMISERGTGQYIPYWAAHTYMEDIAASGAQVLLYRSGYLHAKILSIDGEIVSIGSANIDIRSFSINYELNAVIYDRDAAGQVEADFHRDIADCVEFTVEGYRARGRLLRFRDSVCRLLSPLM
nr:cardiolipin synthase [Paracoccus sp. Z118]